MARGPETRLVNEIRKAIRREWDNSVVEKIHGGPYQSAGLPDLLVIVNGHVVGLEVKAQRRAETEEDAARRVTRIQEATLNQWRLAGASVAVVTSVKQATSVVRRAVQSHP